MSVSPWGVQRARRTARIQLRYAAITLRRASDQLAAAWNGQLLVPFGSWSQRGMLMPRGAGELTLPRGDGELCR